MAKIADVGMSRPMVSDLATAQVIMTPLWSAPEVLCRQRASVKASAPGMPRGMGWGWVASCHQALEPRDALALDPELTQVRCICFRWSLAPQHLSERHLELRHPHLGDRDGAGHHTVPAAVPDPGVDAAGEGWGPAGQDWDSLPRVFCTRHPWTHAGRHDGTQFSGLFVLNKTHPGPQGLQDTDTSARSIMQMDEGAPAMARHIFQQCTQPSPALRPAASQIVEWLRGGTTLPQSTGSG